jgi:3-hydroxyacyl-CoA dehydrogenase
MVQPEAKVEKNDQKAVENLDKKLKKAFEKGATLEKLCKDITLDQAKALAEFHEIEVDANDTVQVLIEAVVEDYKGEE